MNVATGLSLVADQFENVFRQVDGLLDAAAFTRAYKPGASGATIEDLASQVHWSYRQIALDITDMQVNAGIR